MAADPVTFIGGHHIFSWITTPLVHGQQQSIGIGPSNQHWTQVSASDSAFMPSRGGVVMWPNVTITCHSLNTYSEHLDVHESQHSSLVRGARPALLASML